MPADAWSVLEHARWGSAADVRCPHCGAAGRTRHLAAPDGRRTRTGTMSTRRLWVCLACRSQFSVLTGTALAGTRIDPGRWVAAIALLADLGRAPTAPEIARRTGVTREAAGRMARLLTAAATTPSVHTALDAPG